jgi:uncharacterized protein YndB with AHSA1/START domain
MAIATVTPDQDAIVTEIEILASPQRVFQALIDPKQMREWGSNTNFEVTLWEIDARVGGLWRFVSHEKSGKHETGVSDFDHHGKILELDPPKLLVQTWFANWHESPTRETVVRWELTPTAKGTKLKVTHSGLAQMPSARKGYSGGWSGLLEAIKKYVEK